MVDSSRKRQFFSTEPIQVNPNVHCLNAHNMPIFPQFSPLSPLYPIVVMDVNGSHGATAWRCFPPRHHHGAATFDAGAAAAQSAQCNPPISRSPVKADHLCSSLAISVTCPDISQCSNFFLVVHGSWLFDDFGDMFGLIAAQINLSCIFLPRWIELPPVERTKKEVSRRFRHPGREYVPLSPKLQLSSHWQRPGFSRPRVWSSKIWVCLKMRCAKKRWFQPGKCYPVLGQTHMGWTSS